MKVFTKRKFGGKIYTHYNYTWNKESQKQQIKKLKEQGYNIRTVDSKSKHDKRKKLHHIYIRKGE